MKAWVFDPNEKSVTELDYNSNYGYIDWMLICPAYMDAVHPKEYNFVKDFLGAKNALHIATYTLKTTKTHIYKVWARDMLNREVPGTRFFNTDAVFYGKTIVVKYKKTKLPPLDMSKLFEYSMDVQANGNLFYQPSTIVDCEEIMKYDWTDANQPSTSHGYLIEDGFKTMSVKDMLYTCTFCNKCCEYNKCSKCKTVHYCNVSCQKSDWSNHKKTCSK